MKRQTVVTAIESAWYVCISMSCRNHVLVLIYDLFTHLRPYFLFESLDSSDTSMILRIDDVVSGSRKQG